MGTNYFFVKPPTHPMGTTTDVFQNLWSWPPPGFKHSSTEGTMRNLHQNILDASFIYFYQT